MEEAHILNFQTRNELVGVGNVKFKSEVHVYLEKLVRGTTQVDQIKTQFSLNINLVYVLIPSRFSNGALKFML